MQRGLQVWCENCDTDVLNLDFLGQKVKAVNDDDPLPEWLVPQQKA
jgi:hypothetical protein